MGKYQIFKGNACICNIRYNFLPHVHSLEGIQNVIEISYLYFKWKIYKKNEEFERKKIIKHKKTKGGIMSQLL